jgi:uncharacterized 2Fe-2S/4Fe-4S cluster protein (DUF4445 family)
MTKVHEIVFQPDGKRGKTQDGTTVLQAARELGIDINAICGGVASCGKCIVKIQQFKENLSEVTTEEEKILGPEMITRGYRLACCTRIQGRVLVMVPKESRTGSQRLQTEGLDTPINFDPIVSVQRNSVGLDSVLYDSEKIGELPEDKGIYGFAVDIGSTKLAGFLVDLVTGTVLGVESMMNPQITFGEDIITRLTYAMKDQKSQNIIQESVLDGVRSILGKACSKASISTEEVYDFVFVGNSVMQHFLLNIDPNPLARAPFMPLDLSHRDLTSSSMNLGNTNGRVHILPLVAGFIGADCIAATLSTGIHRADKPSFMIDIGTNTEIVLGNKVRLMAASCASGPAFEGAHIKNGMRASTGAIEGVWIDPDTLTPDYKTIDDAPPVGLCGSGIIDVLAEMLKTGIMDTSGRIRPDVNQPRIRRKGNIVEYIVAWDHESASNDDIVITQKDVRELQKGKAAMFAGAKTLMDRMSLSPKDIQNVYMAGAFGTYIERESAIKIGMIPEFSLSSIEQVGNAAGTGARMALISKAARKEAQEIGDKVEYVELATDPHYQKAYLDAMMFPHKDLTLFPQTMRKLKQENIVISKFHERL